MLKVKIISVCSSRSAEQMINNFIANNPNNEIVDIKIGGDGNSNAMTYLIMYNEK